MEFKCDKENWHDVCDQLKRKGADIIEEYDDKCFYIAISRCSKACDLIFWRCNCVNTNALAVIFDDIFPRMRHANDVCVTSGCMNYVHLYESIENNFIAYQMECDYDYTDFNVSELKADKLPHIHLDCFHKLKLIEDEESSSDYDDDDVDDDNDDKYGFSASYIRSCVMDSDDRLRDMIEDIFKVFRNHNKKGMNSN